jgi:hypothetical protein
MKLCTRNTASPSSDDSLHDSVLEWLADVPQRPARAKRRREDSMEATPGAKRRREEASDEETPRAAQILPTLGQDSPRLGRPKYRSSPSATSSASSNRSSPSKKSSIRKIGDLLLNPQPIVEAGFWDDNPPVPVPNTLEAMATDMDRIRRGLGVIPAACKVRTVDTSFFPPLMVEGRHYIATRAKLPAHRE